MKVSVPLKAIPVTVVSIGLAENTTLAPLAIFCSSKFALTNGCKMDPDSSEEQIQRLHPHLLS
ncbi:hypothetical protein ACFVEL_09805 [Bacillus thuringiensis]|uniref:hypothetical protein n=1 Tax=Bacillus thuringiensis TaxID=1428 RepID=UPI00367292DD